MVDTRRNVIRGIIVIDPDTPSVRRGMRGVMEVITGVIITIKASEGIQMMTEVSTTVVDRGKCIENLSMRGIEIVRLRNPRQIECWRI